MGLERFEVGKSRRSYDVPFRSYIFEFEGDFVHVKTGMVFERFEVGKSRTATTSLSDLAFLLIK